MLRSGSGKSWLLAHSGALLLSVHIAIAQEQDSGAVTTSQSRKRAEIHVGFVVMGAIALLTGLVALRRAVVCRKSALSKEQSGSIATLGEDVDIEACAVAVHMDQANNQYALSSLQAKYIQHVIASLPTGCEWVEPDEPVKVHEPFPELLTLPRVSKASAERAMCDPGQVISPKLAKKKLRSKTLSKQGSNGPVEHVPSKRKKVIAKVEKKRVHKDDKTLDSLPVRKRPSTSSREQGNSTFLKIPASSTRDPLDIDPVIDHSASQDIGNAASKCRGSS